MRLATVRYLQGLTAGFICGVIVAAGLIAGWGCSSPRPVAYDYDLEPPSLTTDWCARALTEDGFTFRLCSDSERACRYAAGKAKRYGKHWVIAEDFRMHKVSECRREAASRIHEQKAEVR